MSVQPDRKWEAFAEREPFFAVFTDPKFLSANRTANQEREFFDSGELLVDSIFHTIRKRLTSDFAPESVLEYGCGPGRLAIPFARRSGMPAAFTSRRQRSLRRPRASSISSIRICSSSAFRDRAV